MQCVVAARLASRITFCQYLLDDSICCTLLQTSAIELLQQEIDSLMRQDDIDVSEDGILSKSAEEVLKSPVPGSGLQKLIYMDSWRINL